MPQLRDQRRERFAQAIAKGKSQREASRLAGYSKSVETASHRIRRRVDVDRRVQEISGEAVNIERQALERAASRYAVTTDRIIGELARIGFANMMDYVRISPDGAARFDLASISRDQGAAIQEIIIDEYMDGKGADARQVRRTRLKLADKRAALVDLGKHLGLFVDPSVINMNVANFFSEAPPTLQEWRQEIEAQAVELKPDSTGVLTGALEPAQEKRTKSKR